MAKEIIIYGKNCNCRNATATTMKTIIEKKEEKNESITFTVKLVLGPVCDKCGKPWDKVEK